MTILTAWIDRKTTSITIQRFQPESLLLFCGSSILENWRICTSKPLYFTYRRTNRKAIKFFSLSHNNKDHISITTNFANFTGKRASERRDICFNAYYELILKHTASWGHKQSMHRVREFLERCLPHSKALARESTWTKLIQSHEQKYL